MDKQLMLSVIVITYNQEKYVEKTLQSILNQKTDFDFEILIADDASKDKTPEILEKYQEKYPGKIDLILHDNNIKATRNAYDALIKTKGKYIASIEGDDYWVDYGFLQRYVDFLERETKYSAITGRCLVVDENEKLLEKENKPEGVEFWKFSKKIYSLEDYEEWKMPGHLSATVYRNFIKDAYNNYEIFRTIHEMVGDRTTLLHILGLGNVYCDKEVVLHYRLVQKKEADNWMSVYGLSNKRVDEFKLILRLWNYGKKHVSKELNLEKAVKNKIAAAACIWLLNQSDENKYALETIIKMRGKEAEDRRIAEEAIKQKKYWIEQGNPEHRVEV